MRQEWEIEFIHVYREGNHDYLLVLNTKRL
ncbi:hypothetical protein LINGRAHAP2_LOCUS3055 [Linum grandiflorum]